MCSERELRLPTGLEITRALVERGGSVAVHLRARMDARELFDVARDLAARGWASGGWCVVNGRPDVALAASAHAVQLGRAALPPGDVRRILSGSQVRVGVSVHSGDEARSAVADGADFLVAGTAYPTPSHPGEPGCGASGLARMCRAAPGTPVLAIGGVDGSRIAELVEAGVAGIAVGRAVWDAADPLRAAEGLIEALDRANGSGA